jgi:hypothetical protein
MNNSATSSSSSTSDPNNNCSIEYAITCSDATGQEEKFIFHQHTAPSSLCRQLDLSSHQAKTEISSLMKDLVKTHHREVLQARSWFCVECNRPATTIVHNPMSYLHLSKPQIVDFAIPCCADKKCDTNIQTHFGEMMSEMGVPKGVL